MKKIISPIIYAFSIPVVFLAYVSTIHLIDINFGLHTIFWTGDIDMIMAVLFFGSLVFLYFTKFIIRFENIEKPIFYDHFRQSFLLYIFMIFLILENIINLGGVASGGMQDALSALLSIVALFGIIVNFIVLRRLERCKI
ncbi:MAG: hypothetical protein KBC78_00010 [Candidatus Pacebacteria bacterium]|nr:hypothetical protein [Candidatus Paceibacterota bacterium]